jgi:hypothetical protein
MTALKKAQNPEAVRMMNKMLTMMVLVVSTMQRILIHPCLSDSGRHISVLFSPSLSQNTAVKKSLEKKDKCVCCPRRLSKRAKKKSKLKDGLDDFDGESDDNSFYGFSDDDSENDEDDDDDNLGGFIVKDKKYEEYENDEDWKVNDGHLSSRGVASDKQRKLRPVTKKQTLINNCNKDEDSDRDWDSENEKVSNMGSLQKPKLQKEGPVPPKKKGEGKIIPVPKKYCQLAEKGINHFACESCILDMERDNGHCPTCASLLERLRPSATSQASSTLSEEDILAGGESSDTNEEEIIYCKETFGGFTPTVKLQKVVSDILNISQDDKIM